jgi:PHS family inorganic phosphate transporter-like MFS transporter
MNLLLAGGIFCIDAYDLFVINLVLKLMGEYYPQSTFQTSLISSLTLAGAIFGQILFGILGDLIGRFKSFMITVIMVIVSTLASAFVFDSSLVSIYTWLAVYRFILGVGIGGEYPLSATISSESSSPVNRGQRIALVFSMQGAGVLISSLIVYLSLLATVPNWLIWRYSLGITSIPALIIFYFRYRTFSSQSDTDVYQKIVADRQMTQKKKLSTMFELNRSSIYYLIGTAGSWLIFDIAFYANSLFNATLTEAMGLGNSLMDQSKNAVYLALMALPGYLVAVLTINLIRRKILQWMGFLMIAVLYTVMGIWLSWFKDHRLLLIITYGLTFFFSNFGPNMSTFIIPAEAPVFPTLVRSTSHGISAAMGKIGAVIGVAALKPLVDSLGLSVVLIICGGLSLLGLIWTLIFVPSYTQTDVCNRDLEEIGDQKILLKPSINNA